MSPRRSLPRLALLLLALSVFLAGVVVAAPAAVDQAPQAGIETAANTTGYLQPDADGPSRTAYAYGDVDVTVAVAGDAAAIRARFDVRAFGHALGDADDRSERLAVVREYLNVVEDRVTRLETAHRDARTAFASGTLDRHPFLRELARLDARAARTERLRSAVESAAGRLSPRPRSALIRAQNLEVPLETMGGPATERVRERFAGTRSAGATYLAATGHDGLVVATVADRRLYRDAFDGTQRDPGGVDRFSETGEPEISVALRRAAVLYPWAFENGAAAQPLRGYGDTSVYRITVEHTQGVLSAYLDGATENVFRELAALRAPAVPVTQRYRASNDSLHLQVNATHDTGPMLVTVETASGSPVDGRVTIEGTFVGRTGADGELWTVQPDATATVRVRTDDGDAVAVTVE